MPRTIDPELNLARARAYGSRDPFWWSNLAAVYATRHPPDLRRARKWYRRAAVRRHPRGLFEYGLMLIEGEGGPRRPTQGRRLLEVAANLGEIDALRVLSHAYGRVHLQTVSRQGPAGQAGPAASVGSASPVVSWLTSWRAKRRPRGCTRRLRSEWPLEPTDLQKRQVCACIYLHTNYRDSSAPQRTGASE
jgi:hypothetical protein